MPKQFENVTAVAKANIYFDGRVISHTIIDSTGAKHTLGLIYPGEYHFGTAAAEIMELVAGACRVKLAGQTDWTDYAAGQTFNIPADSSFDIVITEGIVEYVCSYV
ncbi:pyrimidine/purine nucleoside phosphorylase [Planctomycetales bacterium ZRK34]|nr:pyrimidine/purine nucleoside phosphorylase [Planctomycetales bacterium ZRK34]